LVIVGNSDFPAAGEALTDWPMPRPALVQYSFKEGSFSERLVLSRRRTILLRGLGPLLARWLLSLLQVLLLLFVFLLQLLRLLLVPLLHLLLSRVISLLLIQPLVLLLLLLLEFLPFLVLFREYFFLLLLVLLVQLRFACVGSARSCRRRKVSRMDGRARPYSVVLRTRS
jgi:hypothetical protein